MTKYIILQQDEQSSLVWLEVGETTASSPARALRTYDLEHEGTFVAVPARSWKPLVVKVEQTTKITIG